MTYSITISGHTDSADDEAKILASTQEFAGGLDGLTSGNFSGQHSGSVDLKPPAEAEAGNEGSPTQEGEE